MDIIKEIFTNLHFIRPLVLWSLPVVLFIVWQILKNNSKDDGWSKICDPHLLDAIKIKSAGQGSRWSLLLWPIAIVAVIAIAGPAFRKMPTPVIKNQSALILALDVSRSMLADDIKPNRLERAKFKINDILEQRQDGQTALIVYAGDAFVVTPLTDDTETIALMLKAITPDIMPVQGSRADIALEKSRDLLQQAGYPSGEIILISDGVSTNKAAEMAADLAKSRIKTSVLAVGSKEGAPIPTARGFVKDTAGNIVIPKLKVKALQKLARAGNGRFSQMSGDSSDINHLIPSSIEQEDEQNKHDMSNEDDAFDTEKYIDEGPWLTLLLLPLLLLMFRKGVLLSLFLLVGLQSPQSSYAFEWDDLWLNSNQKAAKLIDQQQFNQALETATASQLKATAAFRSKDYQQAKELFNDGSADGFYNQGNALAASGKLKEALEAYQSSLQIRPDDEDTLYNKEQVEKALKEQEKQEQKDQENKDQDKKENQEEQQDQDKKDQQNKEDSQDQKEQESDSENKDGEQSKDQQKEDGNPDQEKKKEEQSEMTDEEKRKQEEQEKKLAEEDKKAAEKEAQEQQEKKQQEVKMTPEEMAEDAENKEAIEQWLRRIPDDPGGLLRRKFYYQYNQQNTKPDETEDW